MTDTNQKLREALQLIAWSNDSKWQADCARQALALPTADHLPDAGEMVNGLTQAETDASASVSGLTAAPVCEREAFEREMSKPPFEFCMDRWPDDGSYAWPGGYAAYHTQCAWAAWQARAALSAGDAVDARRYRYHRAVGGQSWREVSDPRNPKRITDALYDVATDEAMRKDNL